ncbi:calcium load-activated calcium channel [Trichonephila clavipes]|nr:calcium load-activated calcium channel [Trichonephila clavipes]
MYNDSFLILFISIFTALLGEGLTWLMVYRTEKYQKLKAGVERQSKRLEKKKEVHGDTVYRQQKKKIEREEEKLKICERKLLESEATTGVFVLLGEQGNKAVLDWVTKEGLIPSRYESPKCKKDMRLVERKGTIDGFEWRCRVQSKENPHFVAGV